MAPSLQDARITFIGGGNMAAAIIGGLLARGISKQNLSVSEPMAEGRAKFEPQGVRTSDSNTAFLAEADVIILAVKPQVARAVCTQLGGAMGERKPVVVSIAAGVLLRQLKEWFKAAGSEPHVVRVMPNTPALVGEGASGLFAEEDVTREERELTSALLACVSPATEWVGKEKLLDVITGVSGSGPAYFFMMVEHLVASAIEQGLDAEQAKRLAAQTCLGAGKMLVSSSESPSQLRRNVTSPNGTTHAAIQSYEASNFDKVVDQAVRAAVSRSEELGKA